MLDFCTARVQIEKKKKPRIMAPFKKCSCCKVRTRKVIRDPATRKNIYVCPTCFKTKKYLKTDNQKNAQPAEEETQVYVAKENLQNDGPEQAMEYQENKENERGPLEHQEKLNEAEKRDVQEVILQDDLVEELPMISTTTIPNTRPKITPPLMEIVIMNNRKYIAVSETADAVNE